MLANYGIKARAQDSTSALPASKPAYLSMGSALDCDPGLHGGKNTKLGPRQSISIPTATSRTPWAVGSSASRIGGVTSAVFLCGMPAARLRVCGSDAGDVPRVHQRSVFRAKRTDGRWTTTLPISPLLRRTLPGVPYMGIPAPIARQVSNCPSRISSAHRSCPLRLLYSYIRRARSSDTSPNPAVHLLRRNHFDYRRRELRDRYE
ncbi:hypothetical protein DENSPDRAFT_110196 [Dentipellis sp. KUC8613]|nr:hypothetical protein DENSPDRAFT_110196 [Dentipellis sp. KUC8613]